MPKQRSRESKTAEIQRLNDLLRCHAYGGRIVATRGIAALASTQIDTIFTAIASFDAFNKDNDPYDEHDCASLDVEGIRVLWKIDYYDTTLSKGSEDPSNPEVTTRVLTVMLAEEY